MYFLNINKPKGITSFGVIRKLRKRLNIKQIGHSGTLDPQASGVMQVGVGKAAKLLDYLDSDKEYIAEIAFGYVSDTLDSEGEKEFIKKPDFSNSKLQDVLQSFVGITMQTPPKYSAIKHNGKKLCDLARCDIEIDIEKFKREIEIYSIELLFFENDFAKIKVSCRKGTYIRSLVHDIGQKLGCGAYMSALKRTKAGKFNIEDSCEIESELIKINPLDVLDYPKIELSSEQYDRIKNGNYIKTKATFDKDIILLTKDNKLVSIAYLSDNLIKPKKFFGEGE